MSKKARRGEDPREDPRILSHAVYEAGQRLSGSLEALREATGGPAEALLARSVQLGERLATLETARSALEAALRPSRARQEEGRDG